MQRGNLLYCLPSKGTQKIFWLNNKAASNVFFYEEGLKCFKMVIYTLYVCVPFFVAYIVSST